MVAESLGYSRTDLGESEECYTQKAGQRRKQWMIEGGDGGGRCLEARTDYAVSERQAAYLWTY